MAKLFGIFACLLIVALDATAGILGIKAEAAQNQVQLPLSDVYIGNMSSNSLAEAGFSPEVQHLTLNM